MFEVKEKSKLYKSVWNAIHTNQTLILEPKYTRLTEQEELELVSEAVKLNQDIEFRHGWLYCWYEIRVNAKEDNAAEYAKFWQGVCSGMIGGISLTCLIFLLFSRDVPSLLNPCFSN